MRTKVRNLATASALSVLFAAQAYAQVTGGFLPGNQPGFPNQPGLPSGPVRPGLPGNNLNNYPDRCNVPPTVQVPIRQWIQSGQRLQIRQLTGLDQNCNGREVRRIALRATSQGGYAQTILLINGQQSGYSQYVSPSNIQNVVMDPDPYANMLGRDIQSLQVLMQGRVYVDSIVVMTAYAQPQPQPYPQPYPQPGPGPGPRPGPGPGPRPGPGPGPQPYPQPVPQPRVIQWSQSAQGGYYDSTGQIQGAMRLPQMRQYGGVFAHSGEPVPMVPVLVNLMGHTCNTPSTAPGLGLCVPPNPVHYE